MKGPILQKELEKSLSAVPRMFLAKLIDQKLQEQDIKVGRSVPDEIARHVLAGSTDSLTIQSTSNHEKVSLEFTKADLAELKRSIEKFLDTGIGKLIPDLTARFSKQLSGRLKGHWKEEHSAQEAEIFLFRQRLEARWGTALDGLRMLLTCVREWAATVQARSRSVVGNNRMVRTILLRLHVRACQVTDEIICLLENGFADGAMARWRTLHELAVVAAVVHQHGEGIAERYFEHQAIESKRAMRKYVRCAALLGYKPLSPFAEKSINKAYSAVISKYGKQFDSDYGWATHHLKKRKVTFADLELEAGRAEMRSYYQMGNDNVHAGIKSLFVRLGLMDNFQGFLAGRSNAGLADPGQNAAHTLVQMSLLVGLSDPVMDDLVAAETLRLVRDEVVKSFFRAHELLRQDEKELRRSATKSGVPVDKSGRGK